MSPEQDREYLGKLVDQAHELSDASEHRQDGSYSVPESKMNVLRLLLKEIIDKESEG